jgi:transcriptional regulator with XRE-family HTH domain
MNVSRPSTPSAKGLTGKQCAEARERLGWSRKELAGMALVAERTVAALEDGRSGPHPRAVENVRLALEVAGARFSDGAERPRSAAAETEAPVVDRRRRKVA